MGWFTRDNTRRGRLVLALLFGALGTVVACRDDAAPTRVAGPMSDASVVSGPPNQQDWRHCENGKDPASVCDWITGNLNATQNIYYEGWYVPHVLRIPDIVDTAPDTLVMTYGFKKGGHHTFDFLGVWDASLPNANVCTESRYADFCTGPVNATTPPPMQAISASTPAGSLAAALVAAAQSCGTSVADSLATAIARAEASGPAIALRGIGLSAISIAGASLDGCGSDVEATIRIVMTPSPGVTSALLLIGAHIARTRDWLGGGATQVPGSPYHLGLVSINGISTGSMDLQMQSAAVIPTGRVVLIKRTLGDVGSFDFTRTDGDAPNPIPASFTMTTGTPGAASSGADTLVFQDVPAGTQVITEAAPTGGWQLTALSCTDPSANTTVSLATRAVTLVVDDSEEIVCTFTNTAAGAIRVVKTAVGGDSTFSFTPTGFGSAFTLTTVSGTQDTTFGNVVPALAASGTYRLSEAALTGWTAGTLSCLLQDGTTSAGDPATGITVAAGETTTCAVTNTKWGVVVVKKVMVGGTGTFSFTEDVTGSISINNGTLSQAVAPGTYHATEASMLGWDLTALSCDDTNSTGDLGTRRATFVVAAGETVTCTFTNTKQPEGTTTRTRGFWSQHQTLIQAFVFGPTGTAPAGYTLATTAFDLLPASVTACATPATRYWDPAYILGGLNANPARTSTGQRRSAIDQARMQLMRQLLAAAMNGIAFGSVPQGSVTLASAFAAYCGTNRTAMMVAAEALTAFNESGDMGAWMIGPMVPANEKFVTTAMIALWDVLP